MSGPIVRSGLSTQYTENWDNIFGEKKQAKAKKKKAMPVYWSSDSCSSNRSLQTPALNNVIVFLIARLTNIKNPRTRCLLSPHLASVCPNHGLGKFARP